MDGKPRCKWVNLHSDQYIKAHDVDFGNVEFDDNKLFEKLCLETLQPGLSFIIVFNKMKYFRRYFYNFNIKKVAQMNFKSVNVMMKDENLIRNKKKLYAIINNARVVTQIQKEYGSFARYIWSFTNYKVIFYKVKTYEDIPGFSPESEKLAKDLKQRGMSYVGPVNLEAYMQFIGSKNAHDLNCFRYKELKKQWYGKDVRSFLK